MNKVWKVERKEKLEIPIKSKSLPLRSKITFSQYWFQEIDLYFTIKLNISVFIY